MGEDAEQSQKGLQFLINSLAFTVHTRVRKEIEHRETALLDKFGQTQQQLTAQQSKQQAMERYYSAFPTHRTEALGGLINQVGAQIAAEMPDAPFDDQFINALGARVNQKLAEMAGAQAAPTPAPAPTPTPTPAPPAKPAGFLPANPGTKPASGGESQEDVVADVFSWE